MPRVTPTSSTRCTFSRHVDRPSAAAGAQGPSPRPALTPRRCMMALLALTPSCDTNPCRNRVGVYACDQNHGGIAAQTLTVSSRYCYRHALQDGGCKLWAHYSAFKRTCDRLYTPVMRVNQHSWVPSMDHEIMVAAST